MDSIRAIALGKAAGGQGITVESLSVTENGTYTAPSGKAYSPITVNVSGGGGTVVALINATYNAGDTVTCSKGAITLTSDSSGSYLFNVPEAGSWTLTDGTITRTVTAAYGEARSVHFESDLPYSVAENIRVLANADNFDSQSRTWDGLYAWTINSASLVDNYVQTDGNYRYQPGNGEKSFTVYLAFQGTTTSSARLCAIYTGDSYPGRPCWSQENRKVIVYDNGNVDTDKSCLEKHVLSISRDESTNTVKWYIDGALFRTSTGYTSTPGYVYFNGTGSAWRDYVTELKIYSMGVVLGAEADETVIANHNRLMNKYGVSA